jgi:hypothetical protein
MAILIGPIANAHLDFFRGTRSPGHPASLDEVPIPHLSQKLMHRLTDLVSIYRTEVAELRYRADRHGAMRCLELREAIDTAVLTAYDLPSPFVEKIRGIMAVNPPPEQRDLRAYVDLVDDAPSSVPDLSHLGVNVNDPLPEAVQAADAALDADLLRLEQRLRVERPDLFDGSGAFREDMAQRHLEAEAARRKAAAERDLATLTRRRDRRSADAP